MTKTQEHEHVAEAKARARAIHGDLYVGAFPRADDGRYPLGAVLIAMQGVTRAQESVTWLLDGGRDGLPGITECLVSPAWAQELRESVGLA